MNIVIQTIKEHIANKNIRFVFPSQTAVSLWARKICTLGISRSVALNRFLAWDRFKEEITEKAEKEPVTAIMRKLFATLDSTSRRLELPGGLSVLLVDTVGFIRRLPHSLVKAFHSTLEEASLSDLIINVIDASDLDWESHYKTTLSVLAELGAADIPRIDVFNKTDKLENPAVIKAAENDNAKTQAIPVSAITGAGLPELLARMESTLSGDVRRYSFPQTRTDLAALLHRSGTVLSEKYLDDTIEMEARVDEKTAGKLKEYQIGPDA
jgi:GTP-binding protein HflX